MTATRRSPACRLQAVDIKKNLLVFFTLFWLGRMRMWLARLFGGRKVEEEERPARIAPRLTDSPAVPVKRPLSVGNAKRGIHADKVNKAKSGFDPYNSGSFERGKAWERISRR
jgi:hypothetical protein